MKIESTTHNQQFHEEASIFSIESSDSHIFTAGGDGKIRSWHISIENIESEKKMLSSTAINTSTKISYCNVFEKHRATVNCVRINEEKNLLATGGDDGYVVIWEIKDCAPAFSSIVFKGEKCTEVCWAGNNLIVGFNTGNIIMIEISRNKNAESLELYKGKVLHNIKPHSSMVDGLCYNSEHNLISSISRDKSCKVFLVGEKLKQVSKLDLFGKEGKICDENETMIFRRHAFSKCGNFLYVVSCVENKKYCVFIVHYPFHENSIYGKIGDFNSPVIKILEREENLYIFTKYEVYVVKDKMVINNFSILPMTDATLYKNIIFSCSVDGFVNSLRIDE